VCVSIDFYKHVLRRTYVADAPRDSAFLARGRSLVCLALDAEVHNVVAANGAVVDDNVPRPESYRVPLRNVSRERVCVAIACSPS
jgi:hypothetical protein